MTDATPVRESAARAVGQEAGRGGRLETRMSGTGTTLMPIVPGRCGNCPGAAATIPVERPGADSAAREIAPAPGRSCRDGSR